MTTRRGSGEGSLHFDASRNRWIGVVDLGRDAAGKRIRRKVTGRTKVDARGKLTQLRQTVDQGLPSCDNRVTLSNLLDDWLDRGLRGERRTEATVANYTWAVRKHLQPRLGARRLRDLSPDDVSDALNDMATAGLSGRSLRLVHAVLTRALRWAERRDLVHRNVAALVDTPTGPSRPSRSLTVDQAQLLLRAAEGHRLEALVMISLMLGLRPGEALGLAWSSVDLAAGRLKVQQSLKQHRGVLTLGDTKTIKSRRTLDLPAAVTDALRAHRARQAEERLLAGGAWVDQGLVFTTTIGTPIDPSNVRKAFSKLTHEAGLGHWHPHELRHSAASILSAAGVPLEQISDLLGHASIQITADIYRHRIDPSISAAVAPMQALFAPPPIAQ